ncbi:unnamed protein product, partial [Urochloa humidicola]
SGFTPTLKSGLDPTQPTWSWNQTHEKLQGSNMRDSCGIMKRKMVAIFLSVVMLFASTAEGRLLEAKSRVTSTGANATMIYSM